ncbi:uncharacterized protein LOC117901314 [Drosophila subobscura]|uniref:uncharacterized protein LOC117901314 n=1 Tax=Drosophila subobscura TaxID=7241 RepID=UPI00155A7AB2|nr:uncharacterized protein LOC117901314 [Drosophila subobscura]
MEKRVTTQVYGMPHDELITYTTRIYGLGFMFALIGLVQWIVIAALDFRVEKLTADRYGWWLACTFFAIATLAWTEFGRKFPINIALIVGIVETSTWYIGFEQSFIQNHLADFYALVIVVSIMFCSIFWGAYFPMYIVPGDLVLSVLVATANIMLFIFFFNAYITGAEAIEVAVRNFFAIFAISMVIYTATIVHDRQFNVPKHEYLFLSVIIFFCYMILQERVLALSYEYSNDMECTSMINETY